MTFNIYVPTAGAALYQIKKGSAVVENVVTFDQVGHIFTIDFEGDIYGDKMSFIDKLYVAAHRHATKYPTVARMHTNFHEVVLVGTALFNDDWKLESIDISPERQHYLIDWIS